MPLVKVSNGMLDDTRQRKNVLINGNFDVWQRATSQTSSGYGSDDRWKNLHNGSTKTSSKQEFVLGQNDVPYSPRYFSRTVVTSVANVANYVKKNQRIEFVRTLEGQQATISFYAKADAAKDISIEFRQYFGTSGSPSITISGIEVTTISLTTAWQKFEVTVNIPSIAGKTLGTDENDWLGITFWFDAGSDYDARTNSLGQQSGTFDISEVQLEKSEVATDFEYRTLAEEISLCKRYYQFGNDVGSYILYSGAAEIGLLEYTNYQFPVEMRISPTIVGTSFTSNGFNPATSVYVSSSKGVRENRTGSSTLSNGLFQSSWTADAEL